MTDLFPEAFKRFLKSNPEAGKSRNFNQLENQFSFWANQKTVMYHTQKQERALAVEARKIGVGGRFKVAHFLSRGKSFTRLRDIETGRFVKHGKESEEIQAD
jgi:hypothetical protein